MYLGTRFHRVIGSQRNVGADLGLLQPATAPTQPNWKWIGEKTCDSLIAEKTCDSVIVEPGAR